MTGAWSLLKAEGEDKDSEDSEAASPCRASRSVIIVILVAIFIANQACRALPFYLVNFHPEAEAEGAMNVALSFGSGKYGLFATMGFTIPFTLGSLVAGVIADRTDRMRVGGIAGLMWSSCTVCMASVSNYPVLLGLRMLLGLSQSITNPASVSMISGLFPKARATMTSVFGLGIYLGGAMASLAAALDVHVGWRYTCVVFGVVSMVTSLSAFLVADRREQAGDCVAGRLEPAESRAAAPEEGHFLSRMAGAAGTVLRRTAEATSSKAARWMLMASALRFCAGFAILVWLPSAMHARFPGRAADFSVSNSVIKAIVGGASSLLGGLTSDALRQHGLGDHTGATFCAITSLISAPLWYMVFSTGLSFEYAMGFLMAEYLTAESWLGPAVSTLQGAVPADRRGSAQGVFSSLTALGNALPACLGLLDSEDLARGLQVSVTACYLVSGLCFFMAARRLRQQVESEPAFLGA